ncbi:phage tail fiber domain-containing protein [Stenotrophomonas muris]|uniref:phage tail fiber domain-containing protein n=1 Tax=Stenotrophomonas muris TaxID=2963283 RepID=UPI0040555B12
MTSRIAIAIEATDSQFSVPFPYISQRHVIVAFNRLIKKAGIDYYWKDAANIEFFTAPGKGVLEVIRNTPTEEALVTFHNGSQLTQEELNMAVLQSLYSTQEMKDYYQALIDGTLDALVLQSGAPTAGPVIDKVIQKILESEELKELQGRIVSIDDTAAALLGVRLQLNRFAEVLDAFAELDGVETGTFLRNLQKQVVDGDKAIAQQLALIGAKSGDGKAWVLNTDTVQVEPGKSLADAFTSLESSIETAASSLKATFDQQVTTLTTANSANALAITQLGTKVDGNSAQIQQTMNTVNGLSANYMLKTDVNGYVAGFGLWNNGATSQFNILADRFAIVSPGYPGVVPFAVDANGVYMNNAYIRNLSVDKISGGAIQSEWALNSSSGRIVLNTGAFMKVLGVGFGMYGDLIEWFGPVMPINQCTKTNATTYVGTDGSAYFGGNLRAGVLYNAAQTTSTSGSAYVDVGPFWTNGKQKTVVVSYQLDNFQQSNAYNRNNMQWNGVNPAATIALYRSINGGGFVECARWSFSGGVSINNEFDGPDIAESHCAGSGTFTDNTGASNITYRAQIISRTDAGFTHVSGINISDWSQRVGIVSTEQ